MKKKLTAAQMRKAKQVLARDRGIGVESITDESVYLNLDAGTVITYDSLCGYNSYTDSGSSSVDTSSSGGFDSGGSGGGCD